jgi:hypothetical protein
MDTVSSNQGYDEALYIIPTTLHSINALKYSSSAKLNFQVFYHSIASFNMHFLHNALALLSVTFAIVQPTLAADHVTVKLFSGSNCDGTLIETAVLGMASLGVCKNGDQAYQSIQTTNVGQSFFGKNILLRTLTGRCGGSGPVIQLDFHLSNDPTKNCHAADAQSFLLT